MLTEYCRKGRLKLIRMGKIIWSRSSCFRRGQSYAQAEVRVEDQRAGLRFKAALSERVGVELHLEGNELRPPVLIFVEHEIFEIRAIARSDHSVGSGGVVEPAEALQSVIAGKRDLGLLARLVDLLPKL